MSVCIQQDKYKKNQFWTYCATIDSNSSFSSFTLKQWKFIKTIKLWKNRYRQRKILASLDQRVLDDIGITYRQALQESAKPFWK